MGDRCVANPLFLFSLSPILESLFLPSSLVIEQPFLAPQSTAITAQRAIRANDAMARNHDANHVCAVRATDGATRVLISELSRHPRIGTRFAHRNRTQNFPGPPLKGRPDWRQRNVELQFP